MLPVQTLKVESGQDIYLCGGGNLAATLLAEKLIDEIILKVNPVVFGSGIPLFSGSHQGLPTQPLQLIDHKVYGNGLVLLNYQVLY